MLRELHIRNFSIIEDASITFEEGFNVLTGETGAGKSIIISALSLALGERASGDCVRSGAKEALVEAFFDLRPGALRASALQYLEDSGIDVSDGLVLKRIVSPQGRSRAYINGSMVNVQTLAEISRDIIDVHGQYEHQSLLSPDKQLDLIDAYGALFPEREEVSRSYESLLMINQQIRDIRNREKDRAERLDMLDYQVREIDAAGLTAGEDEELAGAEKILGSAARLAELAHSAYGLLFTSDTACLSSLPGVIENLREISSTDSRAREALAAAEEAMALLEEAAYFLRDYRDKIEFSPEKLDSIQQRLELIRGLKRKYGGSIEDILNLRDRAGREREELEHSEEKILELERKQQDLKKELTVSCRSLSKKRKAAAGKIAAQVEAELARLSMGGTAFSISITQEQGDDTDDGLKATAAGVDRAEFLIAPNVGEEMKPVARIASGGELSRIMLALKGTFAENDSIPVLVFDEIDAGIGGQAAETVGRKLKGLADTHQIISITHLPQIAACAGTHLKIEKSVEGKRTVVHVSAVDSEERVSEVARMLSGSTSRASLEHAREMLKKGRC